MKTICRIHEIFNSFLNSENFNDIYYHAPETTSTVQRLFLTIVGPIFTPDQRIFQ